MVMVSLLFGSALLTSIAVLEPPAAMAERGSAASVMLKKPRHSRAHRRIAHGVHSRPSPQWQPTQSLIGGGLAESGGERAVIPSPSVRALANLPQCPCRPSAMQEHLARGHCGWTTWPIAAGLRGQWQLSDSFSNVVPNLTCSSVTDWE